MKYHFIHALVVTQFESSLTPLDWETLSAQDYPLDYNDEDSWGWEGATWWKREEVIE